MSRIILAICRRSMGATLGCLALASAAHAQWLNPPTGASVIQADGNAGTVVLQWLRTPPRLCGRHRQRGDPHSKLLDKQSSPASGNGVSTHLWWLALIFRASVKGEEMLGIGRMDGNQWFERVELPVSGDRSQGGAIVFADAGQSVVAYSVPPLGSPRDERVPCLGIPIPVTSLAMRTISPPARLVMTPGCGSHCGLKFGGPLPQFGFDLGELSTTPPDRLRRRRPVRRGRSFPGSGDSVECRCRHRHDTVGPGLESGGPTPGAQLRRFCHLGLLTNSTDTSDRTSITAVMMVPRFLFSHLQLIDVCVGAVTFDGNGDPVSRAEGAVQRLDGGPITPAA
ncbi:MAG: hypothetical protein IPK27_12490 [Rhodanobacteraceae bacterium]|nr:hypothetical protein [Rhodanobacteraceae bacterium]